MKLEELSKKCEERKGVCKDCPYKQTCNNFQSRLRAIKPTHIKNVMEMDI